MFQSFQRTFRYAPLDSEHNDFSLEDHVELSIDPKTSDSVTGKLKDIRSGWLFFLVTCTISLILSTINVTYLSVSRSPYFSAEVLPMKTPSVYMGLERAKTTKQFCRSRITYPMAYSTFQGTDLKGHTKVDIPGDRTNLTFGGDVSAQGTFYIPDYGLENCIFTSFVANDHPMLPTRSWNVEVWLLKEPNTLSQKELIGTVKYSSGLQSTTGPFYCPSRSRIFIQLHCVDEDCDVNFHLNGVTYMTTAPGTISKTGFRVKQYEDLSCIHEDI